MTQQLYLPETVVRRQRMEHAAAIDAGTVFDPLARRFTAQLQRVDPRLMMVRAREQVPLGCPLVPGFYHLLRRNDDAPISIIPVHEHGRFAEPDSRVFERLAEERDKLRDREQRRDHARDVVNAATRAQVSLDDTIPWSQNSAGRTKNGRG